MALAHESIVYSLVELELCKETSLILTVYVVEDLSIAEPFDRIIPP